MKLLCAALLSVLLAGCQRTSIDPLVFGHVVTLSGENRTNGEAELAAVRLAVDEANSVSGARPVRVLHADAGGRAEGFADQGTRLIAVNRVSGLLGGANQDEIFQLAGPA